jgi:hypothetical protein
MTNICDSLKEYRGFIYVKEFPEEWILNELPGTGRECQYCVGKVWRDGRAMWRNIVIGYCVNCAKYKYNYERGPGFFGNGAEVEWLCPEKSAYKTYLKDIDLETLGNVELRPEHTLENKAVTEKAAREAYVKMLIQDLIHAHDPKRY